MCLIRDLMKKIAKPRVLMKNLRKTPDRKMNKLALKEPNL